MSHKGDLTEAQKLLLQKFPQLPDDDPLIELAAWNASLEQKVDDFGSRLDVWTNAILKQTDLATQQNQLIVSQNLTLQETAKSNAALGQILLPLKQGLTQLQTAFTTLKDTIETHGATLSGLSDESQSLSKKNQHLSKKLDDLTLKLKSLETLKTLNSKVDNLTTALETLTTNVSDLKGGLNANRTVVILLSLFILAVQATQFFAIQGIRERAEWALTKLERLEKR